MIQPPTTKSTSPTTATGFLQPLLQPPTSGEDNVRTQSLVDALIEDAVAADASDIHLDPTGTGYQRRFRTDGVMAERFEIGLADAQRIIRATKSLGNLDVTARPLPQDGRVDLQRGKATLSVRIAVTPTVRGEKITIR